MSLLQTEQQLAPWRRGQVIAERLCAAILHAEGYEEVDPQCPLGGRDGLKDALCKKGGKEFVAAAYFPTTTKTFADIEKKFKGDFAGVAKNSADGLIFFTNQHISPGERATLEKHAAPSPTVLYHVERLIAVLDSPKGYGPRLHFLEIEMSKEEQQSYWANFGSDVTAGMAELNKKLDIVLSRTQHWAGGLQGASSIGLPVPSLDTLLDAPTSKLSIGLLCWLNRLALEDVDMPEISKGKLRLVQVWVGGTRESPEFVPPPPAKVPELLLEFISWWEEQHLALVTGDIESQIAGLASFHHKFLSIHPFVDGNGQVARMLLDQAARELVKRSIASRVVADPGAYFASLRDADMGDPAQLVNLIRSAAI